MQETQSKYRVKRARTGMGLGLFATTRIEKSEFIIEYTGEVITSAEADTRGTRYLFELDDDYTIDGSERGNTARYINHYCNPNTEAVIEDGQIRFYALRAINQGEEISYDYGEEYVAQFIRPYGCKCPAKKHL